MGIELPTIPFGNAYLCTIAWQFKVTLDQKYNLFSIDLVKWFHYYSPTVKVDKVQMDVLFSLCTHFLQDMKHAIIECKMITGTQ